LRRNSQDYNLPATLIGATPYWLAAKFLEADIMRTLLEAGANPATPLPDGTTPLMAAAGMKEPNARDADRRGLSLLDGGRLPDESRVVDAVAVALLHAQDIDAVNRTGDTALHAAATMSYERVVRLLAEKGANLNLKNSRDLTPLGILAGRNRAAQPADASRANVVEFLRKLGAVE
jgi:ankyrin repeat protein